MTTYPHSLSLRAARERYFEMNGFNVLRSLRKAHTIEFMPVAMLTGLPAREGEQEARNLDVNQYLTKL